MGCSILSCCGQSTIGSNIVTPPQGSQACDCSPSTITIYSGSYICATLLEVAAIPTSSFNRICLYNGFLSGGDAGGSCVYAWDSVSTAVHTGFNVVQPTDQAGVVLTPGRWIQTPSP